jgi:drug/metabolite transporter (DMT)-like permease
LNLGADARRIFIADAALLFCAFIWGLGIPLSADIVRTLSPLWGSALRMSAAGAAVVLIFPGKLLRSTRKDWKYGILMASILTGTFLLMGFALVYSTASKQSFIVGASTFLVPMLSWAATRRRPHGLVFAGAGFATAGLMIMGFTPGMLFNFGDALNVLMCFFYAAQIICTAIAVKDAGDPRALVAIQLPLVGASLILIALIFEGPPNLAAISAATWGEIAFAGLVNTVLCLLLQSIAQKSTSAAHAGIILSLESFFGYLVSVLSGQDPFIVQGALGGALILSGVLLSELETLLSR